MRNIHFPSELYIWKRFVSQAMQLFHYSYKKVGHGVVAYTIFMFIPKTGCAKMHCACAMNVCQGGSISKNA